MRRAVFLNDSVGMNTPASLPASPLPSFDREEALPRPPRPTPAEPRARRPRAWSRCTLTLVALGYALTACALGATVVAGGLPLRAVEPAAVVCALAACAAEWQARRAGTARARDLTPAVYLAAALLLPAPIAVLVALPAIVAGLAARRGVRAPVALRFADGAHTVLSVALLAIATHLALGDRTALDAVTGVLALAHHPLALLTLAQTGLPSLDLTRVGTPIVWSAAALHAPAAPGVLLALCAGYYLFETVPSALARALRQRHGPARAWRDLYGYALPLQLVALPLAPVVVALYAATPLLTLAALPLLCGLPWIAAGLRRAPALADEAGARRADMAALYTRTVVAEERAATRGAALETLLAAIQGLGGNDDLAAVTATLARAAARLTSFRDCTVYLYESRDGVFVPYAGQPDGPRRGEVVSRPRAEALMSARFRRGYSYYVPRAGRDNVETARTHAGPDNAPAPWREGDSVVAPLLLKSGDVIGYIELDRPADKRVPTAADLAPLETLAFLAASTIARLRHTDEVLHLAASDGLTGLLNRRAFEEHLHRELSAAARRKRPLALMMIDIDDFGAVNNTYGHQVGDAALRLVSGVIRAHLRDSDAGGRYGGDEFTVVLPELDAVHAADIAERLRAALAAETCRAAAEGSLPQIYTSIGVASFPAHADDARTLIKAADDALYESKRMGKNCVSLKQ
jgi:diguanylate cyclase (GGDEF)-like protein